MHLYDQLIQLQQLEHAFTAWESYRLDLTHFILRHVTPTSSVAIVGAGKCNDIDLSILASKVSSITLLDKDLSSMLQAVEQYTLGTTPNVAVQKIDLVGITSSMYRSYADALMSVVRLYGNATKAEDLAVVAHQFLDQFTPLIQAPIALDTSSYDVVIAVGLHSQLLSMLEWIWHIMLETCSLEEYSVRERIISLNTQCIKNLNDTLLQATGHTLIIGYEESRLDRPGTIQGAIQCAHDLQRRQYDKTFYVKQATHLHWPFHKAHQIGYMMHIVALYKDS